MDRIGRTICHVLVFIATVTFCIAFGGLLRGNIVDAVTAGIVSIAASMLRRLLQVELGS